MAVKDIVAGAEMFLRTAGVADENIRRQLLQRVQQQALEKGQMDIQNIQGYQTMAQGFGPGTPPEQIVKQTLPFVSPAQGATLATGLASQQNTAEMNKERIGAALQSLQDKIQSSKELTDIKLQAQRDLLNLQTQLKGSGGEYHPPISTTQGYQQWDAKLGKWVPALGPDGKPLMAPIASPDLTEQKRLASLHAEKIMKFPKAQNAVNGLMRQWDTTGKIIDKAISQIGPFTAGIGSYLAAIPATEAKNLQRNIESIQANIAFDKLQNMRENAPTGGALGQVSDLENKLLAAVQGSLAQDQSPAQLLGNLTTIRSMLEQLKQEKIRFFEQDFGDINPEIKGISQEPKTPSKNNDPLGIR